MLLLADVDGDILSLGACSDDHSLVYGHARADKESASLLSGVQSVGYGVACLKRDKRTLVTGDDLALPRLVAVEHVVHNAVAVCIGEEFGTVAHQTSGGNLELDVGHAAVAGSHIDKLSLARTELFHYRTDV